MKQTQISMNGKDKLAAIAGFGLGVLIARIISNKKMISIKSQPSIFQYLNRFSEFFDNEHIPRVQNVFFDLIDNGLNPNEAFFETINKVET